MTDDELNAIEARAEAGTGSMVTLTRLAYVDIPALVAEVRRLRAKVELRERDSRRGTPHPRPAGGDVRLGGWTRTRADCQWHLIVLDDARAAAWGPEMTYACGVVRKIIDSEKPVSKPIDKCGECAGALARQEERAAVVAWLRRQAAADDGDSRIAALLLENAADGIEAGDHLPTETTR